MGDKKFHPLTQMYRSVWGRIVISAAVTALALCAFSAVQTISYLINDDNAIVYSLAGYHTGTPVPYALFINCLLGYVVSGLYTATPAVPWWAVLQLVTVAIAMTTVGACLLSVGRRRGAPLALPVTIHGALLLLICLQPVVELTYTVTAAILGGAGVTLAICAAGVQSPGKRLAERILAGAFVVTAFLYREETGFAVLCFLFAACGYGVLTALATGKGAELVSDAPNNPEEAMAGEPSSNVRATRSPGKLALENGLLFLITLALCLGAFVFNNGMQRAYHGNDYRTFFTYRERFTDYPRDSYDQNPELYASVGWDKAVYDLADQWCFMDPRINAETLKTITEEGTTQRPSVVEAAQASLEVAEESLPLRLTGAFLLCVGVMALYCWFRRRQRWPEAVGVACMLLGSAVLLLMLGLSGRVLERAVRVVAIPACMTTALLVLAMFSPSGQRENRMAFVAFAGIAAVLSVLAGGFQAKELRVNGPQLLLAQSRAVTAYAMEHPDNAYVRDAYVITDVDAITVYEEAKPTNLISWGGCEMHSRTANEQLALNGLDSCYADILLKPNVYFISRPGSTEYAAMEQYMAQVYGAELTLIEMITDTAGVYQARVG